jgi:hypothetical protein
VKFECHTHHLLDAIRKRKLLAGLTPKGGQAYLDWFEKSLPGLVKTPVFVLRDNPDILVDDTMAEIATAWQAEGRLKLPYPEGMFLEMRVVLEDGLTEMIWIVHAQRIEAYGPEQEHIRALLFIAPDELCPLWQAMPRIVSAYPGGRRQMTAPLWEGLTYPDKDNPPHDIQMIHDNVSYAFSVLAGTLIMMASPAVEMTSVMVPKEINRSRRIMKRSPIPDHTILRLPRVAYVESDGTGTHRRPRMHWRRPHTRHYQDGKTTEIPLTLVAKVEGAPVPPAPTVEIVTRRRLTAGAALRRRPC